MASSNTPNKFTLFAKINNQLASIYPKTIADNVMYDETNTVKDVIDSIIAEITRIEKILSIDSVYIRDNNNILLDDGSGSNLVAVASLVAEKTPSE